MGSLFSSSRPAITQVVTPAPVTPAPVQTPILDPLPPLMPSPPKPIPQYVMPLPPPSIPVLPSLPQQSIHDRVNQLQASQPVYTPPPSYTASPPPSPALAPAAPAAAPTPSTGGSTSGSATDGGNGSGSAGGSDPDTDQIVALLDRRRSRFGTILTGSTGVLALNDLVPTRRTLLGE